MNLSNMNGRNIRRDKRAEIQRYLLLKIETVRRFRKTDNRNPLLFSLLNLSVLINFEKLSEP